MLGVPEGFSRIMTGDVADVRELGPRDVEGIETRGGSILYTSRANPTKDPDALANVVKALAGLGVEGLVTIGGDDTAHSAGRLAEASAGSLRVAHVPKTIDNDLPLPPGIPTFGFETARLLGAQLARNLAEDARTTRRFYLITAMGRSAGHLAVGIGHSSGAILTLIPEELDAPVPLASVVDRVEAAVVKRIANGHPYGAVVLAEGIVDRVAKKDLSRVGNIEKDEHGNPRLSEISLGKLVKDALSPRLEARGVKAAFIAKELGYELRCADPCAFDVEYTRQLGVAAVDFLAEGKGNAMVTVEGGNAVPVALDALRDPATGKTLVRRFDATQDAYRTLRRLEARISKAELEGSRLAALAAASKEKPEAFKARFAGIAEVP